VPRPTVDVVVPFVGSLEALEQLSATLIRIRLRAGDSVVIVDNTPEREGAPRGDGASGHADPPAIPILRAPQRSTPGYARNRGAAVGRAEWLVFLDADTEPPENRLDSYFEPQPDERTAVLGGGVRDEHVAGDGPPAARYAYIRAAMSQEDTFRFGPWGFPKTANAAFRRTAFDAVGGFREDIRAAEDADLSYRLRAGGWGIERRERASVTHRSRQTVRSFVLQRALYGAGGAWLDRHHPGSFPPRRRRGVIWWAIRSATRGLAAAARSRDRDTALWAVFEPLEALLWEFGRSLPNERPLTPSVWWRAVRALWGVRGTQRL
jgi:mycofactocin glycosyltransferase